MTPGQQLDRSAVAELRTGQSGADVRARFGEPRRSELASSGERTDNYLVVFRRRVPEFRRALVVRSLSVRDEPNGTVEKFTFHVGELRLYPTILGWEAGEPIDEAIVRGIERGVHSLADLERTFGQPAIKSYDRDGTLQVSWCFLQQMPAHGWRGKELLVQLNAEERVQDFVWREFRDDWAN